MNRSIILLVMLFCASPVSAHLVEYDVSRGEAVVVTLTYGDGAPLTHERYDIRLDDQTEPYQSGFTDESGRIVFLPHRQASWQVRVFTEDGHGTDFTIEAGPAGTDAAADKTPLIERFAKPVLGVGIIFLVFGLLALFIRGRR